MVDGQPVLVTIILPLPVAPAGNVTVEDVAVENVNVAAVPLTVAVEPEIKPVPVSVITWPLAAHALVGDTAVIVGTGLTVNALPAPVVETQLPLLTTILPLPVAPAGNVTVDDVAVENVNVAAVPLTVAVEPAVKLVPVSVIT